MQHIMIDIETLDTRPSAVILSIGAVEFDPIDGSLGRTFYRNVDPNSCTAAGLTLGTDTVMWWLEQDKDAVRALAADRVSLSDALKALRFAIMDPSAQSQIWCHGPAFDSVILENAYRAVGEFKPWAYRQVRCTRTIYDLAGINLADFASGTYHNALDDARNQARAVIAAYRKLGLAA